jgi:hypothetical protein
MMPTVFQKYKLTVLVHVTIKSLDLDTRNHKKELFKQHNKIRPLATVVVITNLLVLVPCPSLLQLFLP